MSRIETKSDVAARAGEDVNRAVDLGDKERAPVSPQAQRALDEAERRRTTQAKAQAALEIGGRGGLDPARYGDWEVKGLTSDF
jgi:hypothetical protein